MSIKIKKNLGVEWITLRDSSKKDFLNQHLVVQSYKSIFYITNVSCRIFGWLLICITVETFRSRKNILSLEIYWHVNDEKGEKKRKRGGKVSKKRRLRETMYGPFCRIGWTTTEALYPLRNLLSGCQIEPNLPIWKFWRSFDWIRVLFRPLECSFAALSV